MDCIDLETCEVFQGTEGPTAPLICVIDLPEHPFGIAEAAHGRRASVARIPIAAWGDNLTPWPAPGELLDSVVPALERRDGIRPRALAICGYSLGGLFAFHAFCRDARLIACASLSGSLWYEGLVEDLERRPFDGAGRYAYFSLGKKEPRSGAPIMRRVQARMERCAELCRAYGCDVDIAMGPGNHMQHHQERLEAGISALDSFLGRQDDGHDTMCPD